MVVNHLPHLLRACVADTRHKRHLDPHEGSPKSLGILLKDCKSFAVRPPVLRSGRPQTASAQILILQALAPAIMRYLRLVSVLCFSAYAATAMAALRGSTLARNGTACADDADWIAPEGYSNCNHRALQANGERIITGVANSLMEDHFDVNAHYMWTLVETDAGETVKVDTPPGERYVSQSVRWVIKDKSTAEVTNSRKPYQQRFSERYVGVWQDARVPAAEGGALRCFPVVPVACVGAERRKLGYRHVLSPREAGVATVAGAGTSTVQCPERRRRLTAPQPGACGQSTSMAATASFSSAWACSILRALPSRRRTATRRVCGCVTRLRHGSCAVLGRVCSAHAANALRINVYA